ncbi:MAG: UDP-glucose/GDP-mannose dehydrogenase family protein [Chloroflexota bacterium]|nr:UDP-glucose/GDP-mannose dehydrogenase family protein [Chloroflexota bacterium]
MNVTIFGTGYVGLVTGACLADGGHDVVCVDVDAVKVAMLNRGEVPIFEPGLNEVVGRNVRAGRLAFTTDAARGVAHGLFQFIAVGTPPGSDGASDLRYVYQVARTIGDAMDGHRVIVTKSTVPVGTTDRIRALVAERLATRGLDIPFQTVSNPEFLKEGAAVEDFMRPDRIVVGSEGREELELLRELYAPFNRNHNRLVAMGVRSAELTKYAANAMLAARISFMNEIANIAERVGADIEQVRIGVGSDPRIGYDFIYAGCGYGGSCFPKDVQSLERTAAGHDYDATLLRAVEAVNGRQKRLLFDKVSAHYGGDLAGKTLAIWGLAFKPNTDDMREAPSRVLIEALWAAGATVRAFDPVAGMEARRIWGDRPDLTLCDSAEEAVEGADALVIVTEWRMFRSPDFAMLRRGLREPVIFDGRNIYDPARIAAEGFTYYGIGRGDRLPVAVEASGARLG